jgi:D-3-phosphoglycerate dehydrogenase
MKVFIADKFEKGGIDELERIGCEVDYQPGTSGKQLTDALIATHAHMLIVRSTRVPRETMERTTALEVIVRAGSGCDNIDLTAATDLGIRVCNCPGCNSVAVAELTIGLMIALDRRIVDETEDLRHRVWNKKEYSKARGLKGRTLGIVGMGRIGEEVAKRAAAFDMNLIYTDVIARPDPERWYGLRKVTLDDLLRRSDFVTLHVTGGPQTRHLIGERELGLMQPDAFLINCSRGGVVDESALAEAIETGRLAGAALDVYEVEPTAPESVFADPIVGVPHVYGTHHVGASTEQAQTAVADEVVRIVQAYAEEGELMHCINPPVPA